MSPVRTRAFTEAQSWPGLRVTLSPGYVPFVIDPSYARARGSPCKVNKLHLYTPRRAEGPPGGRTPA